MNARRCAFVAALLAAGSACAQYPARGQPEPAFNGGRPRVVAVTEPAGSHRATAIVPLTATRFAVLGVRDFETLDFVSIVDTTPEKVTTFDAAVAMPSSWQTLSSIASAGTHVVLGGALRRSDGTQRATLQVREIGVGAVPQFDERGTIVSAPSIPERPLLATSAVAAYAASASETRIWAARTHFATDFGCGVSSVVRLDHAAGTLTERHQIDLRTALSQPCVAAFYATRQPARPSDPDHADAVLIGASCRGAPNDIVHVCVIRLLDTGTSLGVDRSFGSNGVARFGAGTGLNYLPRGLQVDSDGNIVVPADRLSAGGQQQSGLLIRLRPSGALDTAFGSGGTVQIAAQGNHVGGASIASDGTVQAVGSSSTASGMRPYVFYFDPATGTSQLSTLEFLPAEPRYVTAGYTAVASLPAGGALAVGGVTTGPNTGHTLVARLAGDHEIVTLLEYFHAAFGHYFVTAVVDEIRKLDDGTFAGWTRTGESLAVLPVSAAQAADVCRFYSATFTPKSSHFYTPIASECDGLKAGGTWDYEGLVFALRMPSAPGICPPGTVPLYRVYNDGRSGAPNHRFTHSDALRALQVAQGWLEEGNGSPPVFACVMR